MVSTMKQFSALVLGAAMSSFVAAQEPKPQRVLNTSLSNVVLEQQDTPNSYIPGTVLAQDSCSYNFSCPSYDLEAPSPQTMDFSFGRRGVLQTSVDERHRLRINARWELGEQYFIEIDRKQHMRNPWDNRAVTPMEKDLYKKSWTASFNFRW